MKSDRTKHSVPFRQIDRIQEPSPAQFVQDAWAVGGSISTAGLGYGRIHWDNQQDIAYWPQTYYRLLAGAARLIGATTALEIGTHWGGSARAITRGMEPGGRVVTIDITNESDDCLPYCQERSMIEKIVGDANSQEVVERVLSGLSTIDLLFIDAAHEFTPTLLNFTLYSTLLQPKVVLFDDILLNNEMARFWEIIRNRYPDSSINCVDIIPDVRVGDDTCPSPGFGLILMPWRPRVH